MKLKSVDADAPTTKEQLDEAIRAFRNAKAKSQGLSEAARTAAEEVEAAGKAVAEALTAHTGVRFKVGYRGELELT